MVTGEYPIIVLQSVNHDEGTGRLTFTATVCAIAVAVPLAFIAAASGFLWRILLG